MATRLYKTTDVFEEGLNRMRWLFEEFNNNVCVNFSGGKDSTVVLNLALIVARERNALPLKVFFLDQEAEWQATIDEIKAVMYDPEVEPYWFQVPFKMENSASTEGKWQKIWGKGEEWIRPQDPISIKDIGYDTSGLEFYDLFSHFLDWKFPKQKACLVGGVRAEENPNRALGLTRMATYKWITWGKKTEMAKNAKIHFTFYPIYDWTYADVWKAIADNNWRYCKIYDKQYQYGYNIQNMRVSSLHHSTSLSSLYSLQELEPETYEAIVHRMSGVDTVGKLGKEDHYVKELPFMFTDWVEYRDYLLENLIKREDEREIFRHAFEKFDNKYSKYIDMERIAQLEITCIISNDLYMVKLKNAERHHDFIAADKRRIAENA